MTEPPRDFPSAPPESSEGVYRYFWREALHGRDVFDRTAARILLLLLHALAVLVCLALYVVGRMFR